MRVGGKLVAALLAGVAMAVPVAAQAWSTAVQAPPPPTETAQDRAESAEPAPSEMEFRDADDNVLPPEIQQQLREQFKDSLPPVVDEDAAPSTSPGAESSSDDEGGIVVAGQRPRGSVVGDVPAERTFSPLEIRAYGASNISELIDALGPQVSSSRGREDSGPVTLLNGRRVSSFMEIAQIPTEAIERMEVFPEEVALQYGYQADQKVVNIVTFERFRSQNGRLAYALPTEGGYDTASINAGYFAIRGDTRFDFGAKYSNSRALLESERDLQQLSGPPAEGRFRTLIPKTEQIALSGLVGGNLLGDVASTLNGRFEASGSDSFVGLGVNGPLMRARDTYTTHLGTTLHGRLGKWLWTFVGNYDRISTEVLTDVGDTFETSDKTRSVNTSANADLVLNGSLLSLPAGPLSLSLRGGVELRDFSSRSLRGEVAQRGGLSRDKGSLQGNLAMPITSRRKQRTAWLGNLTANVNFAIERFSDFGTLRTFGYGINWSPIEAINLIASATNEEGAPTIEQLGAPLVVTPNVRTFDFTRREVVDITQMFGGNPNLRSDDRRVIRLGLNAKPFARTDLTLSVDYVSTRIDDPIVSFPIVTQEIEAAFPDRFMRDADGRLLQVDSRPLNFEKSRQEQLRWGINFVRPLGPVPKGFQSAPARVYSSEADARAAAPPGAVVTTAQPGSAMARTLENMSSRLYFTLYHTWHLQDEVVVRQDLPPLNLLGGAAIDLRGGRRRHELEFQAGAFKRGLGARVSLKWQNGTTMRSLGDGGGNLSFSDLATVNINLFANLADRFGGDTRPPWLKGTRVAIGITNLFNTRPKVRDEMGEIPLRHQPAYFDPLGRLVSFSIRKVF